KDWDKYKQTNVSHSGGESNQNTILKAVNISKAYESPAGKTVILKDINFAVKKGEFVSIVGPSGSGKSTLLNIIGALDRPTAGKVYIKQVDIFSLSDRKIAK